MMSAKDAPAVLTLDAGGTNFVFSAMRGTEEILDPVVLPSRAHDLDACLQTIVTGFKTVQERLPHTAAAISFAFPGPADYPAGIIGDLGNLPAFRGGVALGPMLEDMFGLPVFINNDGDLFALGEAIAGFLPWVNGRLERAGSPRRFKNLFGITLGTGFGGGLVRDGKLHCGDNSAAGEIWIMRNRHFPASFAEEGVSIRAVQRVYRETAGVDADLDPKEIFHIAEGTARGDQRAALSAFRMLGQAAGDALAQAVTLFDSLVVIGGGLAGASRFILPAVVEEMNGSLETLSKKAVKRLISTAYNLEEPGQLEAFVQGQKREIQVPGSGRTMLYDPEQRTGVGISKLGTSRAVAVGAYAFAMERIGTAEQTRGS